MTASTASADRGALTRSAAYASIAVAALLAVLKTWAVWKSDSTAMLGSLADTGLDLIASLVTLAGVRIAALPADSDHRFGHGKAEALVSLVQIVLITISAGWIAERSIRRLLAGSATGSAELGIGVSLVAMVVTLALIAYQRRVVAEEADTEVAPAAEQAPHATGGMVVIHGQVPASVLRLAADGADSTLLLQERFELLDGQAVRAQLVRALRGLVALRVVPPPPGHGLHAPGPVVRDVLPVPRVAAVLAPAVAAVGS